MAVIVKVQVLVDDCTKCPHLDCHVYDKDGKPVQGAGLPKDGGMCSILGQKIIAGNILADCPFEELDCPDHHTQELV